MLPTSAPSEGAAIGDALGADAPTPRFFTGWRARNRARARRISAARRSRGVASPLSTCAPGDRVPGPVGRSRSALDCLGAARHQLIAHYPRARRSPRPCGYRSRWRARQRRRAAGRRRYRVAATGSADPVRSLPNGAVPSTSAVSIAEAAARSTTYASPMRRWRARHRRQRENRRQQQRPVPAQRARRAPRTGRRLQFGGSTPTTMEGPAVTRRRIEPDVEIGAYRRGIAPQLGEDAVGLARRRAPQSSGLYAFPLRARKTPRARRGSPGSPRSAAADRTPTGRAGSDRGCERRRNRDRSSSPARRARSGPARIALGSSWSGPAVVAADQQVLHLARTPQRGRGIEAVFEIAVGPAFRTDQRRAEHERHIHVRAASPDRRRDRGSANCFRAAARQARASRTSTSATALHRLGTMAPRDHPAFRQTPPSLRQLIYHFPS